MAGRPARREGSASSEKRSRGSVEMEEDFLPLVARRASKPQKRRRLGGKSPLPAHTTMWSTDLGKGSHLVRGFRPPTKCKLTRRKL
jgi:hypothetical protein